MIMCEVLLPDATECCVVPMVYASNDDDVRKNLWKELVDTANHPLLSNKAWLVIGDFNQIANPEEHSSPPFSECG